MLEFVEFLKDENTIKINGIWDKNIIEMAWENFIFEPKTKSLTLKADNFSHKNFLNFFSKIRRNLGENKDQNFRINSKEIIFDFSNLKQIDTAGICFFLALQSDLKAAKIELKKVGLSPANATLFALCEKNYTRIKEEKKQAKESVFVRVGKAVIYGLHSMRRFIEFTGVVFWAMFKSVKHPSTIRFVAFLYHIEHSAIKAMPIIILTSLLVGVVLAYQAAYQLAQFGANIYIVDLVGISATRELAPLIAAIVIAGRSASSYTAQIGVMKITDEINAMNTMGFNSARFIIIPRVMGLCFAMPFIVAVADIVSIGGGMFVANFSLDINYIEFMRRFQEAVALKHVVIGLAKAPVFGFLIGLIACFRGFGVKNTTESIGIYTTKSVVNAIFWVIAFDAIFSIFLTQAGI